MHGAYACHALMHHTHGRSWIPNSQSPLGGAGAAARGRSYKTIVHRVKRGAIPQVLDWLHGAQRQFGPIPKTCMSSRLGILYHLSQGPFAFKWFRSVSSHTVHPARPRPGVLCPLPRTAARSRRAASVIFLWSFQLTAVVRKGQRKCRNKMLKECPGL
jgi:hypothetical protein